MSAIGLLIGMGAERPGRVSPSFKLGGWQSLVRVVDVGLESPLVYYDIACIAECFKTQGLQRLPYNHSAFG